MYKLLNPKKLNNSIIKEYTCWCIYWIYVNDIYNKTIIKTKPLNNQQIKDSLMEKIQKKNIRRNYITISIP